MITEINRRPDNHIFPKMQASKDWVFHTTLPYKSLRNNVINVIISFRLLMQNMSKTYYLSPYTSSQTKISKVTASNLILVKENVIGDMTKAYFS